MMAPYLSADASRAPELPARLVRIYRITVNYLPIFNSTYIDIR